MPYTLELLHFSDQEGAAAALDDAPALSAVLNALRDEDLGGDGLADNTLTLSSAMPIFRRVLRRLRGHLGRRRRRCR